MRNTIHLLIKFFDKEEHADAFIQRGELFCRTLGGFKNINEEDGRGDQYEAVTNWHQPDQIEITLIVENPEGTKSSVPIENLVGPIVIQNIGYDRLNLYCMYSIHTPESNEHYETESERIALVEKFNAVLKEKSTLSDDVLSFGEFAVIVYRVSEFIGMVNKISSEKNFTCWHGLIKYYDPDTFNGSFNELESVFMKRDRYEYQSEYRFAFTSNEPEGNKIFHLGSLDKIAIKIRTRDINGSLQLKLPD